MEKDDKPRRAPQETADIFVARVGFDLFLIKSG